MLVAHGGVSSLFICLLFSAELIKINTDLLFTSEEEVKEFILKHRVPAEGANDKKRYAEAADMLSAAKCFKVNIVTWTEYKSAAKWQHYTPAMQDSVSFF